MDGRAALEADIPLLHPFGTAELFQINMWAFMLLWKAEAKRLKPEFSLRPRPPPSQHSSVLRLKTKLILKIVSAVSVMLLQDEFRSPKMAEVMDP